MNGVAGPELTTPLAPSLETRPRLNVPQGGLVQQFANLKGGNTYHVALQSEQAMGPRHPDQLVPHVGPRAPDRGQLRVLAEGVVDLTVARGDEIMDGGEVEQGLVGDGVHAAHQFVEATRDDEVGTVPLERFHGRGRTGERSMSRPRSHSRRSSSL